MRSLVIFALYVVAASAVAVQQVQSAGVERGLLVGVAALVLAGLLFFVIRFIVPWWRGYRVLRAALDGLEAVRAESRETQHPVTDLGRITDILADGLLIHAWTEFEDTLHVQYEGAADALGRRSIARYRQTVPAEVYFSHSALIEVPLRTEFFKHLPGMLTGLGIIGTFLGLILGLSEFDVQAASPETLAASTSQLIESVYNAFFVSLFAILVAIGITVLEKLLINQRIAQTAGLCDALDFMFDAGAGEEYLSRLVHASEEGAVQTTQLKDALVAEISEVLERMTQMQIEALREGARAQSEATREAASIIAGEVSREITNTFAEPLRVMSDSISATNSSTQERVGEVLKDLLAQFSSQVESMFGDQMAQLAGLLQETSVAMKDTLGRLDGLAEGMEQAGQKAVEGMGEALQQQIGGIAMQLGSEMARALGEVQSATAELQASLLSGQRDLNDATQTAIGDLTQQIASTTESTTEATTAIRETVTSLAESTHEALEAFEASTRRLETAVGQIQQAGMALAGNLKEASDIVSGLNRASKVSADSLSAIETVVTEMKEGASGIATSLEHVRDVVEAAERDAETTSELVEAINTSSKALSEAQSSSTEFLSGLEEALVKAHDDFVRQVDQSLNATTAAFHGDLEKATRQLSGVVKELGDVLDEVLETRTDG